MATLGEVLVKVGADLSEFNGGMKQVSQQVNQLQNSFGQTGKELSKTMQELGAYTSQSMNQAANYLEQFKERFIAANDAFQAKATQSEKMIKNLSKLDVRGLDQQFLKIGVALETMAKRGTVANVALTELGRNASMKDIIDHIKYINQGIARMQAVALVAGVALAGLTAALWNAAKGAKPGDVLKQQADLIQQYTQTLNDRAKEIYDFAGLFEKVVLKTNVSGKQLTQNLQGQVKIMREWATNLQTLAKRGVDQGLIAELQKMGPSAAAEIQALTKMSDAELNNYVALWREKHALARTEATSELAQLKQETDKKIKELGASITNLGVSIEKFKGTWASALKPFITLWGNLAAKVVDVFTKLGEFVNKLNAINPAMSQAIGMFMYLFTALTLILSPLAIGISRAGSFAAAFNVLYTSIKPFVTGLLSIAGTAAIVAAAIVVIGVALYNLWTKSEKFRNAIINLWEGIKNAAIEAFSPLMGSFEQLKQAFTNMVKTVTGGGIGEFWTKLGDTIAQVINTIASVALPILEGAFKIKATVIGGVIDFLVMAFQGIADWWNQNGSGISDTVSTVFGYVKQAFAAVGSFIASQIPQIVSIIQKAFAVIKQIVQLVMPFIVDLITVGWDAIKLIIGVAMAVIVPIIQNAWELIKGFISAALVAISGILDVFLNLLQGNWSGAWNALVSTLTSILTILWNAIQQTFIGQILNVIISFCQSVWNVISSVFQAIFNVIATIITSILNVITSVLTVIFTVIATIWNAIMSVIAVVLGIILMIISTTWNAVKTVITTVLQAVWNVISTVWNAIVAVVTSVMNAIKAVVLPIWNAIKAGVTAVVNAIKSVITSVWNAIKSVISSVMSAISAVVIPIWNSIKSGITTVVNAIKSTVSNVWNSIKSTTSSIFNGIKSTATSVWNGIKNAITQPIDSAKNTVLNIIDAIKGAFARMTIHIPKPKLPHIKVGTGSFMGVSYPTFSLEWYAKGGIIDGASVVGVGEQGAEQILPIENRRRMKPYASMVADLMSKQMGSNQSKEDQSGVNIHIEQLVVREEADVRRIAEELYKIQVRRGRIGGAGLVY